jgi:hypothetical protein
LREDAAHSVDNNLGFRKVGGCALNEQVARLDRNLRQFAIDDRRKLEHFPLGIQDNRVDRRCINYGEILLQLTLRLLPVVIEKLLGVEFARLLQRLEDDLTDSRKFIYTET